MPAPEICRATRLTAVAAMLLGCASALAAQPVDPDVSEALAYMASQQQVDGSFEPAAPLTSRYHTTAKVSEVLHCLPIAADIYWPARSFISARQLHTVEDRSRRLLVSNYPEDAIAISASQNSDGGFGSEPGFDSNVLDTALAVVALRSSGAPTGAVAQNLSVAADSSVTVTVEVPPEATALEILIGAISGTVEVRIKEGSEPTPFEPYYFEVSADHTLLHIDPTTLIPLVPGTNYIQFYSVSGSTVSFQAYYVAPLQDTTALNEAADYLLSARNTDGGWGFSPGNENSQLYYTYWAGRALASIALFDSPESFVLSKQIGSAFGDRGTANVFDTAVALRTLAEQGNDPAVSVPAAISYLEAAQAVDGGFEDDPYRTAWALAALLAVRPPQAPLILSNGGAGPGQNYVTNQSQVTIEGIAPAGAIGISVDDPTAVITFDEITGRYSITVDLAEGTNVLTITALNVAGTAGSPVVITVTRDSALLSQVLQLVKGFNMVGLRLEPANSISAFDLLDLFGADARELSRLDSLAGNFEIAVCVGLGCSGSDFGLAGLDSLVVLADAPTSAMIVGLAIPEPTVSLLAGVETLTIPDPPVDLDAFGLLTLIGDESVISGLQRFNTVSGAFETAAYRGTAPAGVNFPIESGIAYLVFMQLDVPAFALPISYVVDVEITDPADGATITTSPVLVSGNVTGEPPVTITVNGFDASVVGGTFSAWVPLVTPGSTVITALATDAGSRTDSDSITVTYDQVDHSIPLGGFAVGSRYFSGDAAALDQTAFYTVTEIGIPVGVDFTTQAVTRISLTEVQVDYRIDATPSAPLGIHSFQVEYGLLDADQNPLGPLFGNIFDFRIEITP